MSASRRVVHSGGDFLTSHLIEMLLLLEQLRLLGVQVLHGVGIGTCSRRHAAHHGGGIHLGVRSRDSHVREVLHAPGLTSGLAGVVGHARSHAGVAGGDAGMLLHAARMRRKVGSHACHHSALSIIHRVDIDVGRTVLSHATNPERGAAGTGRGSGAGSLMTATGTLCARGNGRLSRARCAAKAVGGAFA